jgi:DNA-binding MarR family transcriptional regulator
LFERCMYFNTNALVRKLNRIWDEAFARYDLAPSHGYLIRLVLEKPGLSQQDIAKTLKLEKSTIARFVTQLERRGFVQRTICKPDPRQNAILPGEKSLALRGELEALGDALYAKMCRVIGPKNVKDFVASVRSVSDQL